jgi:hypothetical protein
LEGVTPLARRFLRRFWLFLAAELARGFLLGGKAGALGVVNAHHVDVGDCDLSHWGLLVCRCCLILHLLIFLRLGAAPGIAFLTILTAFASAAVSAGHSTLIALAVLFEAPRFLAVATLGVEPSIAVDLGLECMRVTVFYSIHCHLAFLITFLIRAVEAIAVRPAPFSKRKAVAIELEALRLLAIAGWSARGSGFIALALFFALAARFE